MKNKYTINHFIKKFSAIPRKLWITGTYNAGGEACCALGHCGARLGSPTNESRALVSIISKTDDSVGAINDYCTPRFPQKTPRGRILAALKSLKK